MVGRYTCDFLGDPTIRRFRLPFPGRPSYALQAIESDARTPAYRVVVLLSIDPEAPKDCNDKIVAVLKLPPYQTGEAIEFACRLKTQSLENGQMVIGVGSNKKGRLRYFVARLAWKVDLSTLAFEPIVGKLTVCDSTGYAGSG
jgi:hypothetical protein